jgi:hypothetical protein
VIDELEVGQQSQVLLKPNGMKVKVIAGKSERNTYERKLLLLGNSHERRIDSKCQENLDTQFDICSISYQVLLLQRL